MLMLIRSKTSKNPTIITKIGYYERRRAVDGPTEYVQPHVPDTTPGTPDQLWAAFAEKAAFEPKTSGERSAWEKITTQWAEDGLTVTDIKRAVAGFRSAHPGQPVHIWEVNHGISAYIALMTPRDADQAPREPVTLRTVDTRGVIEHEGDVPPPPEILEEFPPTIRTATDED